MKAGLEALVHPRGASEMRQCFLDDVPLVVHGLRSSVAELFAIPHLASLEALLGSWPDEVDVHLPDVADEASTIRALPTNARRLFANGMGLLFDEAQRYVPQILPWLHAIRNDLGLSALTRQRCLIYATPAEKGTAPHFDQNVNFVLQLRGTKIWRLAPNTHVERPLTRHTIGQPVDPELQSYATLPMPDELPGNQSEIVLEPGSLLFVPRGMWHATHAITDALALNFTFSPPTWIDIFTAALRNRLALSRAWRQTAAPLAVGTFDALLSGLAEDATSWAAEDILAATESAP